MKKKIKSPSAIKYNKKMLGCIFKPQEFQRGTILTIQYQTYNIIIWCKQEKSY